MSREPRCTPRASRASASSCRTVPTRQGTHCPHDSSRKNAAIRRSIAGKSADVSRASTTPDPSVAPISRVPSRVSGTSSWSGDTKPPAAPPSSTARSSPRTPPASTSSSRSVVPKSTSYTPGVGTAPATQNSFVPVERPAPIEANAGPPTARISRTL